MSHSNKDFLVEEKGTANSLEIIIFAFLPLMDVDGDKCCSCSLTGDGERTFILSDDSDWCSYDEDIDESESSEE